MSFYEMWDLGKLDFLIEKRRSQSQTERGASLSKKGRKSRRSSPSADPILVQIFPVYFLFWFVIFCFSGVLISSEFLQFFWDFLGSQVQKINSKYGQLIN